MTLIQSFEGKVNESVAVGVYDDVSSIDGDLKLSDRDLTVARGDRVTTKGIYRC